MKSVTPEQDHERPPGNNTREDDGEKGRDVSKEHHRQPVLLTRAGPAATIAVLLASLLASCGGSSDRDGATEQATTTTERRGATTTDPPGDVAAGDEDSGGHAEPDGATGDPAPGAEGAGTGAAAPDPAQPPAPDAGGDDGSQAPAQPARPGTYEYDTDGFTEMSGGFDRRDRMPARTTLVAHPPEGDRQRSVRDMRNDRGDGSVTETVLEYRDDGVYLERITITNHSSGATLRYEFRPSPAPLVAKTGVGPGDRYEFAMDSTDGRIHAEVTIDVLRGEQVRVAGEAVRTLLVRMHTELSGDVRGESTSEDHISPEHRVTVQEQSTTDARFGITRVHSEHTSVLRSLASR